MRFVVWISWYDIFGFAVFMAFILLFGVWESAVCRGYL